MEMKWTPIALILFTALSLQAQQPAPKAASPASPLPASVASASSVPSDTVVISVGDTHFTAAQFNQLIDMLPQQSRSVAQTPNGRKQFADEIVRVVILADEARRRKLDQTPAFKTETAFQQDNLLAGRVYAELGKPTDEEMRTYYEAHKAEFEEVRARHILIRAKGSPMPVEAGKKELTDEEALAKAQELRKKIMDGADFAKVAEEESDDSSKSNGGDLNFFHRGQLVPPFEQAAFSLKVGEVSQPVKTPFGYHLIKVEAKKDPTFEEAKPDIEKRIGNTKAKDAVEQMVKKVSVTLDPQFFGPAAAAPAVPVAPK